MKYLAILWLTVVSIHTAAQTVTLDTIATGLTDIVDIMIPSGDNVYVVQKTGEVIAVDINSEASYIYLDISDRVVAGGERGLLGMAFHPDYTNNGKVYVHYTAAGTTSTVSYFTSTGSSLDPDSEQVILTQSQPFNNHNAGAIHFGPDGYLYIPFGDGGSAEDPGNRSQNPQTWLGKMLRIDVDSASPYAVPDDNPFVGSLDTLPEIWSIGLRNPWKFSFDMLTNDMYIADVGQYEWEEVDYQPAASAGGENYGWKCEEGFEVFDPSACGSDIVYTPPIHVYANNQDQDGCSITGGYVHRNTMEPYLYGKYIYGDYCSGRVWALSADSCGDWHNELLIEVPNFNLSTFGQDSDGSVYLGLYNGTVQKITPVCDLQASIIVQNESCAGLADGSITIESNTTDYTIVLPGSDPTSLAPGEYNVQITDEFGCIINTCFTVAVGDPVPPPAVVVFQDTMVLCEGESSSLPTAIVANPGGYDYVVYLDGTIIFTGPDLDITLEEGTYSLALSNGACTSTIVPLIVVVVNPKQIIEIEPFEATIRATEGFTSYQWFSNGDLLPNENSRILQNFVVGDSYTVVGTDEFDCSTDPSPAFTATSTTRVPIPNFHLRQNPVTTELTIHTSSPWSHSLSCTIYDSQGAIVINHKGATTDYEISVDVTSLPAGSYQVVLQNSAGKAVRSFIKIR